MVKNTLHAFINILFQIVSTTVLDGEAAPLEATEAARSRPKLAVDTLLSQL